MSPPPPAVPCSRPRRALAGSERQGNVPSARRKPDDRMTPRPPRCPVCAPGRFLELVPQTIPSQETRPMLFPSWLRSRKHGTAHRPAQATHGLPQRQQARARPSVESLEDRHLLSFGTGGVVTTLIGTSSSAAPGVILSNGNLLAAGFATNAKGHNDFALAEYLPAT